MRPPRGLRFLTVLFTAVFATPRAACLTHSRCAVDAEWMNDGWMNFSFQTLGQTVEENLLLVIGTRPNTHAKQCVHEMNDASHTYDLSLFKYA